MQVLPNESGHVTNEQRNECRDERTVVEQGLSSVDACLQRRISMNWRVRDCARCLLRFDVLVRITRCIKYGD